MAGEVTLQAVAEAAGVSLCTASLAMRGSGLVAAGTRTRVVAVAERLGYRRDAAAALLAGRRKAAVRRRAAGIRVGLLTGGAGWRTRALPVALEAAGYEPVALGMPPVERLRAALRTAWHRGVQGLIIDLREARNRKYLGDALAAGITFGEFTVVSLGPGPFTCVRDSAWQAMVEALERVQAGGYRRIAALLGATDQTRDNDARLAAVLLATERAAGGVEIARHQYSTLADRSVEFAGIADWLRGLRPDAVVLFPGGLTFPLQQQGFAWPRDFALCGVSVPSEPFFADVAGMENDYRVFVQAAVEVFDQQLRLGICGIPRNPVDRVLHLQWRDGPSMIDEIEFRPSGLIARRC